MDGLYGPCVCSSLHRESWRQHESTTRAFVPRRTCRKRSWRRVASHSRTRRHGRDLSRRFGTARVLRTGGRTWIDAKETRDEKDYWPSQLTPTHFTWIQAKDQAILDYQKNKKDTQVGAGPIFSSERSRQVDGSKRRFRNRRTARKLRFDAFERKRNP